MSEPSQVKVGLDLAIGLSLGGFTLDAALRAATGETVVLVGPSGAGKSTLLRAIAGLARPSSGHIRVGGRALFDAGKRLDRPPWQRPVALVFQDFALFPHLTAEQNVRFGLPRGEAGRRRAAEWLEALGIAELAGRYPHQLSGGQQQRVALARAAATDAELLLLDEPFGSLDAATRRTVRSELRRFLQRAAGAEVGPARTVLVVSHDYLDALTLGDRIVVLEEGRITQDSPREEALRHPRTPFLAGVTGHNVLQGTLLPGGAADEREVQVGALTIHVAAGSDLPSGPVFLGFAPHEVSLAPGRSSLSARNQLPATVRELVPFPDRVRVHLHTPAGPLMADVVRSAVADLHLADGAAVTASIKATAIEIYT